jgi:hypothetical protein
MVARIMCAGSEGKHELSARPMMTDRKGDHSFSAQTRGVLRDGMVIKD